MFRMLLKAPLKKTIWTKLPPSTQSTVTCHALYSQHLVQYQPNLKKSNHIGQLQIVRSYSSQQRSSGGGGGGILLALGALIVSGGAALVYAHYDPDFRKTLTGYVPVTDTAIRMLFQEDASVSQSNILKEGYSSLKSSVVGIIAGDQQSKTKGGKVSPPEPQEYKVGEVKPPKDEISEKDVSQLAELEFKIGRSAEEAVNAYNNAVYILKLYNQDIEYIIDEAINQVNPETWEEVRRKTRSKTECLKRAQEKAEQATRDINKLKELVSSPKFEADKTTKDLIKNNISKVQDDIDRAKREMENEIKKGSVAEKYWEKVEKARQHFSEELESMFPGIDLTKRTLRVDVEDLDLFVLHAYQNVLFYQKELAKMETMMQERVRQAVEAAKRGGGDPLTNAQICEAVEQEKRRLMLCFKQSALKMKREADLELREQLKLQSQAFNDHLADAIRTRELEIERGFARKFDEMLEEERCRFKMQLAAIVGRLKGLDQAIKDKNDADEASRQAQVLWSACQALLRAIKAGCPGIPWKDQIRPLEPELKAVEKAAADNDELVCAVLKGVPKEAKERGVYPEDALRERFLKVEQVARTVALVPETGAPLPIHVLSFIQSLLLIKSPSPIPQGELNDEKVDFAKLNTNDILQRARYWLDRGDFAQTLRYMNLLKGAPRCVARQWMNETRILLETQQAANTLMAHAASSGLTYL
nr:unnamed protein product [Callosobruchus chinensis]